MERRERSYPRINLRLSQSEKRFRRGFLWSPRSGGLSGYFAVFLGFFRFRFAVCGKTYEAGCLFAVDPASNADAQNLYKSTFFGFLRGRGKFSNKSVWNFQLRVRTCASAIRSLYMRKFLNKYRNNRQFGSEESYVGNNFIVKFSLMSMTCLSYPMMARKLYKIYSRNG